MTDWIFPSNQIRQLKCKSELKSHISYFTSIKWQIDWLRWELITATQAVCECVNEAEAENIHHCECNRLSIWEMSSTHSHAIAWNCLFRCLKMQSIMGECKIAWHSHYMTIPHQIHSIRLSIYCPVCYSSMSILSFFFLFMLSLFFRVYSITGLFVGHFIIYACSNCHI